MGELAQRLPEDVLAEVLRRLAPRWLAASRGVCRAWRAAVDGRALLRAAADLLPRSLAGIFIDNDKTWMTWLLSRPSAGPAAVSANLDYTHTFSAGDSIFRSGPFKVRDHCNGLVLLEGRVVNPATRRWAPLPAPPPPAQGGHFFYTDEYLAFDPTTSPHYEVVSVPRVYPRFRPGDEPDDPAPALLEQEWPPSRCVIQVFSSRTGRWEERSFARQGPPAGSVADMRSDTSVGHRRYAVYRKGALYVHCQTDFIMRLSLSAGTYQVIEPPIAFQPYEDALNAPGYTRMLSIGKSKKGLYSALIWHDRISVWILDDSDDGQMRWLPKKLRCHLREIEERDYDVLRSHGPWMLQPVTSYGYGNDNSHTSSLQDNITRDKFEWDSDDDDIPPESANRRGYETHVTFLGFHPYKEVIFVNDSMVRVLACHLNSSKIQDLGYVCPQDYMHLYDNEYVNVIASFPYTPCWMGEFP